LICLHCTRGINLLQLQFMQESHGYKKVIYTNNMALSLYIHRQIQNNSMSQTYLPSSYAYHIFNFFLFPTINHKIPNKFCQKACHTPNLDFLLLRFLRHVLAQRTISTLIMNHHFINVAHFS
jgi:hypothetical protein